MADVQSVFRKIFANQSIENKGPLQFRSGQIFYGTIQKLFPNQLAEIKLGSHTLVAKLEIPLAAGQGYWLQVASAEGEPKLRLLDGQGGGMQKPDAAESLLQRLSLPNDAANRKMADFFIRESLPLTKEEVVQASQLLKKAESLDTALETIKFMSNRKMPLTENVFTSLQQAGKETPSHELVGRLRTAIGAEQETATGKAILSLIGSRDGTQSGEAAGKVLNHLFSLAASSSKASSAVQETALSIIRKVDLPPDGATGLQRAEGAARLLSLIAPTPQSASSSSVRASAVPEPKWTDQEAQLVRELAVLSERHFGRQEALGQIKTALGRTGLFYEAGLIKTGGEEMKWEEMLKPLLVRHIQEQADGLPSKDAAQQLLLKMNGQQLLSYESGPIQHLMFEIPLKLSSFETTMKMQWSGKRTEKGAIDPDFCRIIFYLELERLDETVVDMQIQNRVVAVRLINGDQQLQELAQSFLPELKSGLKEMGYTLSSVHFDMPEEGEKTAAQMAPYYRGQTSYSGVDIRI